MHSSAEREVKTRRETDGEVGVATRSSMFRVLIMLNSCVMSSFVARVASTCSAHIKLTTIHSPFLHIKL
jgi:hypothetical protein